MSVVAVPLDCALPASDEDRCWAPWPAQAATVWRAALDAHLPARALHGAGRFAYADTLDENTWL